MVPGTIFPTIGQPFSWKIRGTVLLFMPGSQATVR